MLQTSGGGRQHAHGPEPVQQFKVRKSREQAAREQAVREHSYTRKENIQYISRIFTKRPERILEHRSQGYSYKFYQIKIANLKSLQC